MHTDFGETDYQGYLTVVSSIGLPDSTSYSFTYDSTPGNPCNGSQFCYGLPASMTLPSGGVVNYGYTNWGNRRLTSRTAGAGTWSYTPASATGCPTPNFGCQKVSVAAPDSGTTVYTFTLNNGAWNTETDSLQTVVTTYDFSNPNGWYIRKLSQTSTQGSGSILLNKQTQYT